MYRLIWSDGDRFDYVRDEATMVKQIAERSQSDADGYQRFFEYAKKVFAKGYTELADKPFGRFSDMVAVSPSLIKLRADRSVYNTVAKYVKDDHLRQALSFHSLLVEGIHSNLVNLHTNPLLRERMGCTFSKRRNPCLGQNPCEIVRRVRWRIKTFNSSKIC